MDSTEDEKELNCPLWVDCREPQTGQIFFYNVLTHETSWTDPDPEGAFCFCPELPTDSSAGVVDEKEPSLAEWTAELLKKDNTWKDRPARVQKKHEPSNVQYTEGSESFNVWHGKYDKARFERGRDEPADGRCEPDLDSGWTTAEPHAPFCIFFAQGRCNLGSACQYHHHVPTDEDVSACEVAFDIFGRGRFDCHRDDNAGIGSFNADCKSLFVAGLMFDRSAVEPLADMQNLLISHFRLWGALERVQVISKKGIAFVHYVHRASAEFAKEAMFRQMIGQCEPLNIKWAIEDRNPVAVKRRRTAERIAVNAAMDQAIDKRMEAGQYSHMDLVGLQLAHQDPRYVGVTAAYPDTSAQYTQVVSTADETLADTGDVQEEEFSPTIDLECEAATNIQKMQALLAKIDHACAV